MRVNECIINVVGFIGVSLPGIAIDALRLVVEALGGRVSAGRAQVGHVASFRAVLSFRAWRHRGAGRVGAVVPRQTVEAGVLTNLDGVGWDGKREPPGGQNTCAVDGGGRKLKLAEHKKVVCPLSCHRGGRYTPQV